MNNQVLVVGTSRTQDTKYFRIVTLYYRTKDLMGKRMLEKDEANNDIFLQSKDLQTQLKKQDFKLDVIAKIVYKVRCVEKSCA